MRPIPLTVIKGGINRLRTKGGARADTLYDLVNGFVTDAGTVVNRPGTRRIAELDSSTKGLVSFEGELHVFSHQLVGVPEGFQLHVLTHPDAAIDPTPTISVIHFAAPFLGFLYVVAEFDNGDVFHYWLNSSGEWQANTSYVAGDVVEPTTPTGLNFQAKRLSAPYPAWAPNIPRAVNDIIEPTVYNNFFYTVTDTQGDTPASGATEPTWATEVGAQTIEDTNGGSSSSPTTNDGPMSGVPNSVTDRYGP